MLKTRFALFAAVALLIITPLSAKAFMARAEDSTYIPKDEVVSSSLFAAGSSITVDGKVQGDVICAGQSITINGAVDGDVICAGQSITINGTVGGNVRLAGNSIVIAGRVARNAMIAGANLTIAPQAQIGWDLQYGSAMTDLRGKINRDLDGTGASTIIAGTIGRNVFLTLDDNRKGDDAVKQDSELTITKAANIGGNLTYRSKNDAKIEDGATVKGETKKLDYKAFAETKNKEKGPGAPWWGLFSMFSAILIGLILVSWLKKPMKEITDQLITKPWSGIGWGLLLTIISPIIVIILLFTMIGIPLALILLATWLLMMYIGDIFVAIALGRWIMKKLQPTKPENHNLIWPMIIGIVVVSILYMIPVLGCFLCMIATLWGIGAIWQYARLKS